MNVNNVELESVCGFKEQIPEPTLPEIAFSGKSNVGKSSLLNCLINRKSLARTSSKPGKTQTINFYRVEDELYFVDLPGYGYAKVSKKEKEKWGKIIESYLTERPTLIGVVLLIDIRHKPNINDIQMYNFLKYYGFKVIVVATKKDKLKRSQVKKQTKLVRKSLNMKADDKLIAFSSVKKDGKEELWSEIEKILRFS